MTIEAYMLASLAVLLTGVSKSGFAGGLGILSVPLISLTMEPQAAAVLLLPILVGIDILSVWRYRRSFEARIIALLVPGAAVGIALGMVGFSRIDADWLRLAIGAMALFFVLRFLVGGRSAAGSAAGRTAVFGASLVSGFAGFVAHAGGPPIKGVLLGMNLPKSAFVGTNSVFFFLLNLVKGVGYAALGLFSAESLVASASLVPVLFAGVWLGFALHDRVSEALFARFAYGLLAVAGLNLVGMAVLAIWVP